MKLKRNLIIAASLVFAALVIFFFTGSSSEKKHITTQVKKGDFTITVNSTGELEAENSENISGPTGLQKIRVYNVKITDLVAEGTVVDSGDYVATLDRGEVTGKLKDIEVEIEEAESNFTKVQLDTALELRQLRDDLINKKFEFEEHKINLDQMQYEPPATIRQGEIAVEKSQRAYDQAMKNYKLKVNQSVVKMREASLALSKKSMQRDDLLGVIEQFNIKAPKKGMVIYIKEWNGKKRKVGSTISPWSNEVATLPDLSTMISKTFVNEIDIRKVKKGQKVKIGIDAFPDKSFNGDIISVANVGEQLPNSDAKVFEVQIKLNETDTVLRPSMTTSNLIETKTFKDVLYIPLEAIQTTDTATYIYLKDGLSFKKKKIVTGEANDNE
ncbi:MAG: efflux RND transporter periplasmic adaptor subunit, partial [Bacteroidales bacterium]|nr:efflux RND transporter periplasmic adaptor subunit [Bacteroidales bacterium]